MEIATVVDDAIRFVIANANHKEPIVMATRDHETEINNNSDLPSFDLINGEFQERQHSAANKTAAQNTNQVF